MSKLVKKIRLNTTLEVLTGLHIGGSKDSVEIGGIDNPVIKIATRENQPYIPGSSLKGKIRCLLEQIAGASEVGGTIKGKKDYKFEDKPKVIQEIINLFGFADDKKPSKIIFRDAYLKDESVTKLKKSDSMDMPFTEGKWENVIDRVKGTAEHPRQIERIPAGVIFDIEIVLNVWENDKEEDFKKLLEKGINAIENDYLGGSGSRGYGQIKFGELKYSEISDSTNWKSK